MNLLVHWFLNGNMFLVAWGLVFASTVLGFDRIKRGVFSRDLLLVLGVVLMVASAEALPMWFYAAWAAAILVSLVARSQRVALSRWVRRVLLAVPIVACIAAMAMAFSYRAMPSPGLDRTRPVFVIGDSISAGMGRHTLVNWPTFLRQDHGLNVTNLAVPGATVRTAMAQAALVKADDCVVILEIGGNDLLSDGLAAEFEEQLESLIAAIQSPRRTLVMFELPLPPLANRFGLAQRRLAKEHDIILLPRKVLADVLAAPGATSDSLHLTDLGHKLLADEVAKMFR